jgi:hypothetical protein
MSAPMSNLLNLNLSDLLERAPYVIKYVIHFENKGDKSKKDRWRDVLSVTVPDGFKAQTFANRVSTIINRRSPVISSRLKGNPDYVISRMTVWPHISNKMSDG